MFPSSALVDRLQSDLAQDLLAFAPELILCGSAVLMLLARLFDSTARVHMGYVALVASLGALAVASGQWAGTPALTPRLQNGQVFTGLLVYDAFSLYVRVFLLGFLALAVWLTLLTGIPDREDSADFTTLLLGATVGMMMMASANHLLTVFIAIEMASVPSYALAGFLKGRRLGSEAALKYVVYGASASGVMLFGISLLVAKTGSGYLPHLHQALGPNGPSELADFPFAVGLVFVLVGLGFKLAIVPFHFWCPDVFEGAAAEVAAFLSVASKGAAVALTARFLFTIAGDPDTYSGVTAAGTFGMGLAVFAAVTMTLGNLAALGQTNLKRLLAYSTIAHAGYMLMGLATLTREGMAAVLFYLAAYLIMNLGAFAIVAFLRNRTGSEDLSACPGLVQREPVLVVCLAFYLLSLLGMPPLAGFAAKFQVFAAVYDAGRAAGSQLPTAAYAYYGLLAVAVVNTVISAGYYLKVLRVMVLDSPPENVPEPLPARTSAGASIYAVLLTVAVVAAGVVWDPLTRAAGRAADAFRAQPSADDVRPPEPRAVRQ